METNNAVWLVQENIFEDNQERLLASLNKFNIMQVFIK